MTEIGITKSYQMNLKTRKEKILKKKEEKLIKEKKKLVILCNVNLKEKKDTTV